MHVRKGDQVVVIAGKEKGKRGRVLRLLTAAGRVVIERINMVKRHTKPSQRSPRGGILEKEGSVESSNVSLWCGKCAARRRAHRAAKGRRSAASASSAARLRDRVTKRQAKGKKEPMAEQEDKNEKSQKGAKPTLTPEQEAEAAAKKAARAEAKAKGGKGGGKGKGGARGRDGAGQAHRAARACASSTTPRSGPS